MLRTVTSQFGYLVTSQVCKSTISETGPCESKQLLIVPWLQEGEGYYVADLDHQSGHLHGKRPTPESRDTRQCF